MYISKESFSPLEINIKMSVVIFSGPSGSMTSIFLVLILENRFQTPVLGMGVGEKQTIKQSLLVL